MRTSNKIILGIFLAPLIILTALHLTLYAKYKSGNYTVMKTVTEDRFTRLVLTHIVSVSVYGLNDFNIMPSDTTKLEIEKEHDRLHYVVNGDSLVIRGDSANDQSQGSTRNHHAVNVYLPQGATIRANNSGIELRGSKDTLTAISYRFTLSNSSNFRIREDASSAAAYFKELVFFAAGESKIELTGATRISNMQLQLQATEFTDNGASIDNLSIVADKKSRVILQGDNVAKLQQPKQP